MDDMETHLPNSPLRPCDPAVARGESSTEKVNAIFPRQVANLYPQVSGQFCACVCVFNLECVGIKLAESMCRSCMCREEPSLIE